MKRIKMFFLMTSLSYPAFAQQTVLDKGMKVEWQHVDSSILFTITTPTSGWQAIGFNESQQLKATHLIMSRITEDIGIEVVEHFVESAGDYKPFSYYGIQQSATIIDGKEASGSTLISYKIPIMRRNSLSKDLNIGNTYILHYAYSLDDDFLHHSVYRSSIKIIL